MRPLRSFLFTPGTRPDMLEKAPRSGADALIFDLEDSVAAHLKNEARQHVAEALAREVTHPLFVRINHPSTREAEADLEAVVSDRLSGLILPKAERPSEIELVDRLLSNLESERGIETKQIVLIPLVESCLGLRFCYEMATSTPRVQAMAFSSGEDGDFMVDLGGRWTPEGQAFLYPRSKLVCDSRAAGIDFPVDGVFMNLADEDALLEECRLARTLGYTGKLAIHPKQIAVIHSVFTPSQEEVQYARGVIAAFREAEAEGRAAIRFQGMMVDYANVKRAERILALAESIENKASSA
ncbi:MAG: CoA ester lyase [bacterium]